MYPFIETIRIEQGKACNLSYHNERLNNTLHHFWPDCAGIELGEYLKLTPEMNGMKCRVIYDGSGIKEISYEAYQMRPVHSLQLVYSDDIDYTYKSTDREALNRLFACRGERDDILIVRRGLLTDTSIANIALFDGKDWFTPKLPLLRGTCRTALIDNGIIKEKDILAGGIYGLPALTATDSGYTMSASNLFIDFSGKDGRMTEFFYLPGGAGDIPSLAIELSDGKPGGVEPGGNLCGYRLFRASGSDELRFVVSADGRIAAVLKVKR